MLHSIDDSLKRHVLNKLSQVAFQHFDTKQRQIHNNPNEITPQQYQQLRCEVWDVVQMAVGQMDRERLKMYAENTDYTKLTNHLICTRVDNQVYHGTPMHDRFVRTPMQLQTRNASSPYEACMGSAGTSAMDHVGRAHLIEIASRNLPSAVMTRHQDYGARDMANIARAKVERLREPSSNSASSSHQHQPRYSAWTRVGLRLPYVA